MRRMLTLCALTAAFSVLAMAETYSGRLIDSACYDQQNEQKNVAACDPTGATSSFALFVSGKVIKLNDDGNTKAAAALKERADRSTDPAKPAESGVAATISGSMDGDKLKVDKIAVQ